MKRLALAALLLLAACGSESTEIPMCEKPMAAPAVNEFGVPGVFFDKPNAEKLMKMLQGLDLNTCKA